MRVDARVTGDEGPDFVGEWMVIAVAGAMYEPDVFCSRIAGQGVQHADHGCQANPGTDEHDGPMGFGKHELARGFVCVDERSLLEMLVKMAGRNPVVLPLHAESVVPVAGPIGKRVSAANRLVMARHLQLNGQVLTGLEFRQQSSVAGLQDE